jgi:2-oxoglutarate dehydrogenase E2 component (dihydrolipoamide succinyltransferase)
MSGGGMQSVASTNRVEMPLSPAVRKMVTENNVDPSSIPGSGKGGRITKGDVIENLARPSAAPTTPTKSAPTAPRFEPRTSGVQEERREPMTQLRKTIAKRLVEAQKTAAILTTFNEIDMTAAMALRKKYGEKFEKSHGLKLGFMGLFAKAAIEALKAYPRVNASIDGDDVVYKNFVNLGIAVSTERGLLVPVIRDADQLSLSEIEKGIAHFAGKARDNKISVDDLSGGTFTISNGGVFGSLMSTPILNPPQSGILGLHKIQERPIVVDGQIVARPMMYVALSYDHRIVDGKESVSFLVRIKECMEDPSRILLEL